MRKLGKIELQKAVVLESTEMKKIYGGSGAYGSSCCAYSTSASGSSFTCIWGAPSAEFMAGPSGWWACGTLQIKSFCRC